MICEVFVSNYALIKELRLSLPAGFSTITGETGAGKSILLGALGLVLGNRADVKALNNPEEKCVVEATFNLSGLTLDSFFDRNGIEYEEETILRREILPSGKSRAFINDTPVLLEVLKELGEHLVDIHSQHDSVLLMNSGFQLQMIDALAKNEKEVLAYNLSFGRYSNLLREREQLMKQLEQKTDTDYLQFLSDELEKARIKPGEENELEENLNRLRHADDIQKSFSTAHSHLNDEFAAINRVHDALKNLESVARFTAVAEALSQRLQSVEIELKDIAIELEQSALTIDVDDEALQQFEERLALINHLMHKHRVAGTKELLLVEQKINDQLHAVLNSERVLADLNIEIEKAFQEVVLHGEKLSESRKITAQLLQKQAAEYLKRLQFLHGILSVEFTPASNPLPTGIDVVQFLFTANEGSKPLPVNKVASGGELSRIMLAVKAILAKTRCLPAIIFDEIDTGVSGETAQRVADILDEMGQNMQVLAITHLPQIAARGTNHFVVHKKAMNGSTVSSIKHINPEERVEEVARLLSGAQITEAARATARELLG